MWPSFSPSNSAVLGLNSTRPSHRRRRRLRLELQLERLEDRQLLSGATSSSPVLFHDTFSSNTPSSAWSFVGGTWSINNGVLSQTGTAAADPKKAMITNQTFPSNLIVTSEVQVNSWTAGDLARAGVGLYTNPSNGNGYNLVFHGTNQVQFLDDKVAWGNAYTFNWQVGTWYWFQLAENNGTLEGKVWAAGTAEPQSWMFQQTGWTDLTGGAPALNGGSASASTGSSTVSFASVSVTTTSTQPDTANAGSAFAATTGSAVTFSQATATGTGPLTYAWNFGDGTTASGTLNPTHTYQSAGTYTAELTVTDALGIAAMSTLTVTVNGSSTSSPTVSAGSPLTVNAGSAVTFSQATESGGTAPFTYSWSFGDGTNQSGSLNPSHTYANPGSDTATVTVTDANNLTSTSSVVVTVTASNVSAPTVIGESPASGATGIAVPNAVLLMSLSATFSEPVQPSTINLTLADSSGNPVAITTNYSDATNTITAWPQVFLAYSTTYTVTVSGAKDAAGNTMASPFKWSFTTASATAATIPTVASVSPSFNGSSVDVATPIAVNFNEAVLANSISSSDFTLVSASGTAVPATISYSDIGTLHTATLTPNAWLAYSTTYTATISGVKDSAGNTMAGPYTWSFVTASGSQTNTQLPLMYQSNLQYVGAFRVPYGASPGNDPASFAWNNEGVAFNPANNSLFLAGFAGSNSIGEVRIPSSIVNSTNISNLATASLLQAPVAVWHQNSSGGYTPSQSLIPNVSGLVAGDGSGVNIGGLQVVNGQLIGTLWDYYDTSGTTTVTHFRFDSLNLSTATVEGMFQVGTNGLNAGFYDGYMGAIPAAWQSALGAPYLTGSVCQNIVGRTSNGPGAFGFNPGTLSTSTPSTTIPYVYYPGSTPLGYPLVNGYGNTNPLYNGNTQISGVFFAPGSSSVLFFGSIGTNTFTYGTGSAANDTTIRAGGKGPHSVNGDYAYQVWAYNANDFLAVKNGQMQPWQLQPYATWNLDFPQSNPAAYLGGVTFDPSSGRLYVVEDGADTGNGYLPVVQVYQLTLDPPPAGSQVVTTPSLATTSVSLQSSTASPSVASGIASNVGANLNSSMTPLVAIQSNPSAGSEIKAASSSSSSISIPKRLPAQESVMPRTDTILGLAVKRSSVVQSGNKHSLASLELLGL